MAFKRPSKFLLATPIQKIAPLGFCLPPQFKKSLSRTYRFFARHPNSKNRSLAHIVFCSPPQFKKSLPSNYQKCMKPCIFVSEISDSDSKNITAPFDLDLKVKIMRKRNAQLQTTSNYHYNIQLMLQAVYNYNPLYAITHVAP